MKKLIILIAVFLAAASVKAQFLNGNPLYAAMDIIQVGDYAGGGIDINYLIKEKYYFQLGTMAFSREAHSTPDDFVARKVYIPFWFFIDVGAIDRLDLKHFSVGRSFHYENKNRLNLGIGIGRLVVEKPVNWTFNGTANSGNYTWEMGSETVPALVLRTKFEFPYKKGFGFKLSANVVVSEAEFMATIGGGILFGKLHKTRKKKQRD